MRSRVDVIIIGGGFAGLSTAYALTTDSNLSVMVLEQEKKLGGHASGRNAGMIRQALSDPYLVRLAKQGREALRKAHSNGWSKLRFKANGSLLLAKGRQISELQKTCDALRKDEVSSEWISREVAQKRVNVLRGTDFKKALYCPSDAMVDIEGLLNEFARRLKSRGVRILNGSGIRSISNNKGAFTVRTEKDIFYSEKVVNAAGAWAGLVGQKAGATPIQFKAYRRHLFFADPVPSFKKNWPFVWDLSHEVYFRPQGDRLLLSPCDKVFFKLRAGKKGKYGVDPLVGKLLIKKLNKFSQGFSGLKIRSKMAGLRTMTPDGRFVIGEDTKLKGFFWVAGLGGHGVTTAFSVGKLASDILLGKKVEPKLKKAFSPGRFSK